MANGIAEALETTTSDAVWYVIDCMKVTWTGASAAEMENGILDRRCPNVSSVVAAKTNCPLWEMANGIAEALETTTSDAVWHVIDRMKVTWRGASAAEMENGILDRRCPNVSSKVAAKTNCPLWKMANGIAEALETTSDAVWHARAPSEAIFKMASSAEMAIGI